MTIYSRLSCCPQVFALFFSNIYGLFAERDINKANILTRNYVLVIFFTGVAGGICQCISSIAFSKSGEALTMRMRTMSFAAMLRQEMGWFDREENNLGALVTQLSSDASSLKVSETRFSLKKVNVTTYLSFYPRTGFVWSSNGCYFECCRRNCMCTSDCIFSWMEIDIGDLTLRSSDDFYGNYAR